MSANSSPRKRLLVGNWKMNLGLSEAQQLAKTLASLNSALRHSELWIAAPSVFAESLVRTVNGKLPIGLQNIHWADSGAFTGEISTQMLSDVGASFTLVGHSERRQLFGETTETAVKRALHSLSAGITTIFCVGETLSERESGRVEQVIDTQLAPLLSSLTSKIAPSLILAYEPVWSIGTGRVAEPWQILEVAQLLAARAEDCSALGQAPHILYGGSVTPENFESILAVSHITGGLIGGASLSGEKMKALAEIADN